ncbi:SEC-C metal-binding domain-containing protein [Novosphingobium meiothermophilum]|uniref:SEC-C metal-binding domain-containing protein n=1 Tax=Novosphingobium meiothermophilum TaxID=2202251 RepID=UPI001F3E2A1E|nr:SEC-C metal-binding domain-containing protein [Novosphingobium meiothermophilum]
MRFPWKRDTRLDAQTQGIVLNGNRDIAQPSPSRRGADGFKIGRNDPCPCGSGKKFKKCCIA